MSARVSVLPSHRRTWLTKPRGHAAYESLGRVDFVAERREGGDSAHDEASVYRPPAKSNGERKKRPTGTGIRTWAPAARRNM